MTKFLFTTLPSNDLGLLTRSLPIARELRNMGHDIVFSSPAEAPNRLIADAGFKNILPEWSLFYIMSGDTGVQSFCRLFRSGHLWRDSRLLWSCLGRMLQSGTARIWNIDHFMYILGMWNKKIVRTAVGAIQDVIHEYDPDVIVDFWNPFACIAARASNNPLVSVIQADIHPQSSGFIWWKHPPDDIPSPVPSINAVLAEHDLPPIKQTGDLLEGDTTLVVGMPETDPLPDTADVSYIGPILWQKNDELPEWIFDLSPEKPLIWLYPGNPRYMPVYNSPFDSVVIIKACIEALQDMPVQVVLSTGHHDLPKQLVPLPSNFRQASFLPGLAMAKRCDLLIHHGGYGSCQTGLFTGTPAVIIPTYSERESNARRLAALGAADFVLPKTESSGKKKYLDPKAVRTKVNQILSDMSFQKNATKIMNKLHNYGGASEAASVIEKCC